MGRKRFKTLPGGGAASVICMDRNIDLVHRGIGSQHDLAMASAVVGGLNPKMGNILDGSPYLVGDATTPGVPLPKELKDMIPVIDRACRDLGLTYPPFVAQMLNYDEMSEVAAYGGFPLRYSHWTFGMAFEELAKSYRYGNSKIYEMVVNTCPLYIYLLASNPLVDHITVIAHALGHGDFFLNNLFFRPTSQNMMNDLASHGVRIKKYSSRWGQDVVGEWLDKLLSIDDLIDPQNTWKPRRCKQIDFTDRRDYEHEGRLQVEHDYMESFINTREYIDRQRREIAERETKRHLGIFDGKSRNIFGFLREHAPMAVWQRDVMDMIQIEAEYFSPQRFTKMANEGWASWVDYNIMAKKGLAGPEGIFHYAKHKAGVLGGKYSVNPYSVGFKFFLEIEEKWDKGRHGSDFEKCKNMAARAEWDTKAMAGKDKVFQVRAKYNDYLMVAEFFDREFNDKYKFFEWESLPNGNIEVASRQFNNIKQHMLARYRNGGMPDIRLADPDHRGKGIFLMEHQWDDRTLESRDTANCVAIIQDIWKRPVALVTQDGDGKEVVYYCEGGTDSVEVKVVTREQFEDTKL